MVVGETGGSEERDDAPESGGGEEIGELLSRQIAQRLRTMIATDELPPGTRLRERTLADRLNVSRTPLREALNILRGDGLVTLSPNRGAVVTTLSPSEIREKLAVLSLIEGYAGACATQAASDAEIAEIRALHHEMAAAYERRDRHAYFAANQAIHRAIVEASHNRTLVDVFETINRQVFRYRFQGSVNSDTWGAAMDEHAEIVRLLTGRDGDGLQRVLRDHVGSTWRKLADAAEAQG
jgi:DNA-binding GntR family transcriptional regulator